MAKGRQGCAARTVGTLLAGLAASALCGFLVLANSARSSTGVSSPPTVARVETVAVATAQPQAATVAVPTIAAPTSTATALAPTSAPTPAQTATPSSYTVVAGDSLSAIAARHGCTMAALAGQNGISDPSLIRVGQVLTIPPPDYEASDEAIAEWTAVALSRAAAAIEIAPTEPAATPAPPEPAPTQAPQLAPTDTPVSRAAPAPTQRICCRVCTTGKACGDSCISRSKTCRQPPGCACDG